MGIRFANLTRFGTRQQSREKGILSPLFKKSKVSGNQNFHYHLYKSQSLHYIMGHNNLNTPRPVPVPRPRPRPSHIAHVISVLILSSHLHDLYFLPLPIFFKFFKILVF
jgi:hypothetical protein